MKSRVVRSRDAREIVAQAFADLSQDVMIDFRDTWPNGAINPPAIPDATNAVGSGQQGFNSQAAFKEVDAIGGYHPGFAEAEL